MKPQIVSAAFGGKHNADLSGTIKRLQRQGSWKKQRIIVIIPAGDSIPAKVALAHWNLIFPPNQQIVRILAQGMEVGEAYSSTVESILNHPDLGQWEYILTIEHDNMPPSDGLLKLLEKMEEHPEFSAIGGLYFTKGEGGVAQAWGDPTDPVLNFRPRIPEPNKLLECNGTGMGFTLWRTKMFKDDRLRKPWFKTLAGREGVGTQDLYAWMDFKKFGYRCAIDCSCCVGHYDLQTDIVW